MQVSNEDLLLAYKEHKDTRVKERLHAICLMQIQGRSMAETADLLFRTYQYVHKWHDRYEKYGLVGLEEGSRCGRLPLIPPKIMARIEKLFTKIGTTILPRQVHDYIKEKTGISYHITHVCRLMRKWKLKAKVPQNVHANAASYDECYAWYRHIMCVITRARSEGTKVFVQDETIVSGDGKLTKKYWCNSKERPVYTWKGDHRKFITYGTVSISGERFFRSYEKFDGGTFLRYVKALASKYGRVLVIADRARQHRTIRLQEYLKASRGRVRIEYLPSASPQHNIMETIWFVVKRQMDHGEYYPRLEDKRHSFMEYLRTRNLPSNVLDYFKPKLVNLTNL